MEKHEKSTKILLTTLITFLCGMLVYTGGRYVYAQNKSDSDNLSITVVGKGSVKYTIDDIDYEVAEGVTVYQTVPAEKEVKIQAKPKENNTIDTISCNGDGVKDVSDQNTWEETVKFDKDTVKDYKIIFKEVTESRDTQSQDTSEDVTVPGNAVATEEGKDAVENEGSSSAMTQENSEQVPESDVKENEEKDLRLKGLNIDFNVTDISEETKLIIKAYQSGVYDDKTQIEARKKKAEETKLDKYCDDDYFLTDAYYKKYSEKMLMYDNCVILSRNSTKNVIKENEKEADKYAAKYDKAIQSNSKENSNKVQESFISRLFKTKSVSAANLSVIDCSYHQAWQGGGYISNGIWRLSNNCLSFCADGLGAEPSNGSSGPDNIVNSSNLRKALYYGYGGPGDCLTRRLGTSASIAWTDDLVSMAYTGHSVGSVAVGGYHWRIAGQSYWNEIMSKPDPIQYGYVAHVVSINGGGYNWQGVWKAKQPLAYGVYNPTGKLQIRKTNNNTAFTSGKSGYSLAGAVFTIYKDAGCTNKAGTVSTDTNGNSNTIELNNGTYYVKETKAPSGFNLNTSVKSVTITIGQTSTVSFADTPNGAVRISKTSSNTSLTNENSGYSLNGAQYGIYKDSACKNLITTITTGSNGVSDYVGVTGGQTTYYVKEIKAPTGYQLDSTVYTVSINGMVTTTVSVKDSPQVLKKPLLIHKTDMKSNALANAQFEVKFYKGIITSDFSKLTGTPLTWYLKSDSNGDIYLDSSYLVSGKSSSSFLKDASGNVVLTPGTVTVKEIQTPSKDYVLDENTYLIQVRADSGASELSYSGKVTVIDKSSWPTKVRFTKYSGQIGKGIFGANVMGETIDGTKFLHTLPNGKTETLTYKKYVYTGTGIRFEEYSDSFVEITNLPVGVHKLKEISAGKPLYPVNSSTIEFEVKKDGSIRPIDSIKQGEEFYEHINKNYPEYLEIGVIDSYPTFNWEITKINQNNQPLAGVEFELYGEFKILGSDDYIASLNEESTIKDLGTYKTDTSGKILIKNLKRNTYTNYYLVEKAPAQNYQPSEKDYYNYITYQGKKVFYDSELYIETDFDSDKECIKRTSVAYRPYNSNPDSTNRIQSTNDDATNKAECSDYFSYSGDLNSNFTINTKFVNQDNEPINVRIKKLDNEGNPVQNVPFILYGEEYTYPNPYLGDVGDYGNKEIKYFQKEYQTDENGNLLIKGLKNGDYYLYENLNSEEYRSAPYETTTLNSGLEIKYNIKIKIDNSHFYKARTIDTFIVGETVNGEGDWYHLSLTQTPNHTDDYYSTNENGVKTLNFAYVNQKKKVDLRIIKKDELNKPLKNVEFTIYSNHDCTEKIASAKTDENGEAIFKDLFDSDEIYTDQNKDEEKKKMWYMKETKSPSNVVKPKDEDGNDVVWTITCEGTTLDHSIRSYDFSLTKTGEKDYSYSYIEQDSSREKANFYNVSYLQNQKVTIRNFYKTPKSLYIRKISAGSLDTYDDNLPSGIGNYLDGTTFTHILPNGKTETLTYKSGSSTDDTERKEGFMKITNLTQGRHTIQENTPANSLYSKNPNKLEFTVKSDGSITFSKSDMNVLGGTDTNKIYAVSESADDTSNKLMVTFEDEFSPTKLRIHKTDIGGRALKGAVFTIYGDKDFSETIDTATSDVDGNVLFTKELKNDKEYWVKETQAPNGYQVAYNQYGAPMTYKVMIHTDKDGKKVFINNELVWNNDKNTDLGQDYKVSVTNGASSSQMDMTVINTIPVKSQRSFKFTVHKTNNAGQSLAGAKFTLYMERGCYTPIATGTTNSNGEISFANIFNGKVSEFYMKEIEAPSGYKLPTNEDGSEKVWKIQATMDTNDKLNIYIDDEPVVASESVTSIGNSKYAGKFSTSNGASYALQVNIKNYRLGLLSALPNTGSIMTVVLIVAGMCLVGLAIIKKKNR